MTAQILAAELGNLIQESKRKNSELRNAAEKSLQDLKSLPQTSEAQLAAGKDISRRPHFITPFLIACDTHNAKFASTGVSCLQKLSVSRALPRERLNAVLEALKESVPLSHDVQLKILQALPSLIQNYPTEVRGDLLSTILQICSSLQNAKNPAVSNTAAATLQQLVVTVFDRVASEDERALEVPTVTEVKVDDGMVPVRPAANDAYKMFNDLVLLVTGGKPLFMRFSLIQPASVLELIEAVLSNYGQIMTTHVEQIYILRALLMPFIIRSLSDRLSFPITVRTVRILNLLIRNHLDILPSECEIALGLLNHMLDPEASQLWKRALCLEVFRGIYADARLLLSIYTHFDAAEGKRGIFGDNLAAFVRLAVEKPTLIGLGQQSSVAPSLDDGRSAESQQAVAEAGAIAGLIAGPVAEYSSTTRQLGISSQWSSLKTPCLEQLDKSEPPNLPETYVYSLVLTCITNISESLAKFVLPLTVHHENKSRKKKPEDDDGPDAEVAAPAQEGRRLSRTHSFRKKTIPVNPLDLTDHSAYPHVQTSSILVRECWPAILATCSTFLNATLDTDYYRALVRAIQKLTQVSGLLRLSTPRDAFLTTLSKAAVPSNLFLSGITTPKSTTAGQPGIFSNPKGLLSVDSLTSQSSTMSSDKIPRPSHDITVPALSPRNLLCLRALLNLAIALGPTLQSAWSIIFEALQIADLVMASSNQNNRALTVNSSRADADGQTGKMEAETSAVQAAARRLFESTIDYPNESFLDLLSALCSLIDVSSPSGSDPEAPNTSSRPQILSQRMPGSTSGIFLNTGTNPRDSTFALNKIGEIAALNEARLSQYDPVESGWNILIKAIVQFSTSRHNSTLTRLHAADILSRTVREIAEFSMSDDRREATQARILLALQSQIAALYTDQPKTAETSSETDIRVHQITLEALKSVIEQCGESLVAGWSAVLGSLMSIFLDGGSSSDRDTQTGNRMTRIAREQYQAVEVVSRPLARSAFATVHLVCSDFLAAVPDASLSTLLELLLRFCCQRDDLNMSLTAITFFWNVSDFLQSRSDLSALSSLLGQVREQEEIKSLLSSQLGHGVVPALWLQILLDLTIVTTDERTEVRNSAIQTVQRIFENYDEQTSSDVWMLCLRIVLFGIVQANITVQHDLRTSSHGTGSLDKWNDTTNIVLQTVSILMTMYADKLSPSQLGDVWCELLAHLEQYFLFESYALGASVFGTVSGVLSHLESAQAIGMPSLFKSADIWKAYFDSREKWHTEPEGNQTAFVAYVDAFGAIYRLARRSLNAHLPSMLVNLEACVVDSDVTAYSSDVDSTTTLQTRVMESLALIETDTAGLPTYVVQLLSRFIVLPYTTLDSSRSKNGLTFVALAKTAMAMLQSIVVKHISQGELHSSGALLFALHSLAKPMQEKYIWQREGKLPTLWQKATTTVIAILSSGLPHINDTAYSNATMTETWTTLVDIVHYITRAQLLPTKQLPTPLEQDETFDIESFMQLRDLITLYLGSTAIEDTLRRTYARNLFSTSLISTPLPGELPDLTTTPLDGLLHIRFGQTAQLKTTSRMNMSYACLSELFSLVALHDSSAPRIKLAQAAAPYFILRAALPIKTYIADHPLRGRMPQPESERRELLFVLKELAKLKCEPQAIPDAPSVKSKYRKHLHRLYPLLNQALRVARRDSDVFECIVELMNIVGDEFGLGEE